MKKIICLLVIFMTINAMGEAQNLNLYSYKVGQFEVVLMSEGQGNGKPGILIDATPEMMAQTMPDGTFKNAVNTFLVKTPDQNYLIDTGFGRNLWSNMTAAGVSPEQIRTVIITHMHGDHVGGLLKNGEAAFPNAKVIVSEIEYSYWVNEKKQEAAINIAKKYADRMERIKPEQLGSKTGDGIYFIEAYGHTPGHMVCLIQSDGQQLMIWADLTHAMAIQIPYPEVAVTYDTDPVKAVESRKKILAYVAENKIPVAGMHIPYPAFGRIEKGKEEGYKFIPDL